MTRLSRRLPRRSTSFRSAGRLGMALLELMCAAAVLSATMLVLVPLLTRVGQVRSHLRAREAAVRELGNIVEQVKAGERPSQIAFETVGTRVVSERLAPALDDVRFTARIENEPDEQGAVRARLAQQERVVLTIAWTGEQGTPQTVALACWIPVHEAAPAREVP